VVNDVTEITAARQRLAPEVPSSEHQGNLVSQIDVAMTPSDDLDLDTSTFDELFMTMNFENEYAKNLTAPLQNVLSPFHTPVHNNDELCSDESILHLHASPSSMIEETEPPSSIEGIQPPSSSEKTKPTSRTEETEPSSSTVKKAQSPIRAPSKSTGSRHCKSPKKRSSSSAIVVPNSSSTKENSKGASNCENVTPKNKAKELRQ